MLRLRTVFFIVAISLGSSLATTNASATLIECAFGLNSFDYTPKEVDGSTTTTLDLADAILFTGAVVAGGASGDFSFGDFTPVTMNTDPLIFDPLTPAAGLIPFFTIPTLWSFDLLSIVINSQSATQLNLTGQGIIHDLSTGLEDTPGDWVATFNKSGGNFTWSSSTSTIAEPATLALFGIGLLGLGFMSRRRKRLVA